MTWHYTHYIREHDDNYDEVYRLEVHSSPCTPPRCCNGCCCLDSLRRWTSDRWRCSHRSRTWWRQHDRARSQGPPHSGLQRERQVTERETGHWETDSERDRSQDICLPLCSVESSTPDFLEEGSTETAGRERTAGTLTHTNTQVCM